MKLEFNDQIMCFIGGHEYDHTSHIGILHIGNRNCTDMKGTIEYFEDIDHKVRQIKVLDRDGDMDILYERMEDGTWKAYPQNLPLKEMDFGE